ncbi:MAG: S46 family peptidase [Flavobacterium sp.]
MKRFRSALLIFVYFIATLFAFSQQGGMWIPSLLEGMNEKEMKSIGMKMSAKDIYDVNQSSLKDAIVHFNGGCTSEIISPKGLLLTNHHCGYGEIQSHSTVENDYLENGFWAMRLEDELPNPKLVATFIVKIEDVTTTVLSGVEILKDEASKQKKIEENIKNLTKSFPKESHQEAAVKVFFEGNQYVLFVTETFKDVRLVGAPPSSIGKFGSDTDNWVWPRHTGDFSLFRIYADKNNKPAAYSKDNVPYTPKHFLPVSMDGVAEDDFTLVFGFPGRTNEYLPAIAVAQIVNDLNPARIAIRDAALKVADGFMRKDAAIKIQYASKYARIANYWKKWIGESQGLKKSNAVDIKRNFEADFQKRAIEQNKSEQFGNLLPALEKLYAEITPYAVSREYFMEVALRNTELLTIGYRTQQLISIYETKGEEAFQKQKEALLEFSKDFYKDFNVNVDKNVFEQLIQLYAENSPKEFLPSVLKNIEVQKTTNSMYKKSDLISQERFNQLLSGDSKKILSRLKKDEGVKFVFALTQHYNEAIAPKYNELNTQISALQRNYMKGQLELFPEARIFPDANSTLRVTYGKVKGYQAADAVYYQPVTYLEGVMEKYKPGDYEFNVPEKLISLYNEKDFGPYADANGKMPVCFIGTNHTTGGNSGSPAIDAQGNLIGLNFDRVWEGTMSDIYYDPAICRNIMVDIRYVLFIVDKFAGAKHLIEEMKLVHPKAKVE